MTEFTKAYKRDEGERLVQKPGMRKGSALDPPVIERALTLVTDPHDGRVPSIRSLGPFEVLRRGAPVPSSEWQSKKSRDLIRLLVARRGRPIHRETVIEVLWPGLGSPQGDNRLAVTISRARGTLDPEKGFPPDQFLRTLEDVIWLRVNDLDVDVERFLHLATTGLKAVRDHCIEDAKEALGQAYVLYGGEFLEDQLYEEWSMPLREEARAVFISVALALGEIAGDDGRYESAVQYYSRVLEKDPFAEVAHLGLVRSALIVGRHGEARRLYRTYTDRLAELEIEPSPFPAPSRAG